jgi:CRISPR/Cas system-associated exonuclease Cas4 (RecB family)
LYTQRNKINEGGQRMIIEYKKVYFMEKKFFVAVLLFLAATLCALPSRAASKNEGFLNYAKKGRRGKLKQPLKMARTST